MIPHSRPWIREEDISSVSATLSAGMIASGRKVQEFENLVSKLVGAGQAIARSSGTAAMVLGLRAVGVKVSDEVIVPSYVCRSVMDAVISIGATPVLSDVNEFGVLTAETVISRISKKTKAIVAVHIFGHPCDVGRLKEFGIPIVEDACQAFGLLVDGKFAGSLGDVGIYSFHATKCLSTGEGGGVVTSIPGVAQRIKTLLHENAAPLSDLQAALGLSQLKRYHDFLQRRKEILHAYTAAAAEARLSLGFPSGGNMLFRFTLKTRHPFKSLQIAYERLGVCVRRGVDELLHRHIGLPDSQFPGALHMYDSVISLPFYPALGPEEIGVVCAAMKEVWHGN